MTCLIDFNRYNCSLNNDIKVTTSFKHIKPPLHTQHRRKALKIMFIILIHIGPLSEYYFNIS